MIHDGKVKHLRILDRATHDLVALYASAIIGHGDDARFFELASRRELLALHSNGEATCGIHVDDGLSFDLIHDALDGACVITDGACVRHAHDSGETTCCCRFGATTDIFFVRLAWVAKVDVDIN